MLRVALIRGQECLGAYDLRESSYAFVGDLGYVAFLVCRVGDLLDAAVWEGHAVLTRSLQAVGGLLVAEVIPAVVILYAVCEGIDLRFLKSKTKYFYL